MVAEQREADKNRARMEGTAEVVLLRVEGKTASDQKCRRGERWGWEVLFCVILLALLHPSCLSGLINVHFYLAELHIKHMRLRCFSSDGLSRNVNARSMNFTPLFMPPPRLEALCFHVVCLCALACTSVLLGSIWHRFEGPPSVIRAYNSRSLSPTKQIVRIQEIILQLWQDFTQTVLIV